MNIDERLDKLKKIKPVEAPPFLYTRVKQSISSFDRRPAPIKWRLAFSLTTIMVIAINIIVLVHSQHTKSNDAEKVVSTMQLSSSNELYHE